VQVVAVAVQQQVALADHQLVELAQVAELMQRHQQRTALAVAAVEEHQV
jgi:hypothetical protein